MMRNTTIVLSGATTLLAATVGLVVWLTPTDAKADCPVRCISVLCHKALADGCYNYDRSHALSLNSPTGCGNCITRSTGLALKARTASCTHDRAADDPVSD